ncbi:MAG: flavodoxin-dependent (E)-4-hydroxy-3-methylbut-2-enyl-diphosphate synthase [Oscillospiraceae bacterium]|nr:flavodoxin-dependent (E)-4-hydroxy-3-methylbut-2-enyl-diphosphate synthase [Oscillospiraceae bacterium]MCL2279757.1 flavodoxin-dependent (E)-4-hydroxy-3-methylbut-2-enyl-diphosphate synthase [Oscillospiraceae bacterium]
MKRDYITIESMTTTKTDDIEATVRQINALQALGLDIIRVAVPDISSADAIEKIKENINIPLIADIHFDHKLALRAAEAGADKIRINPGNIGGEMKVKAVADMCKNKNIPIRIGVNGGSLEKKLLEKHGGVTPEAMVESVMSHVALLEKYDFNNIWLSAKSSNVNLTVATYRLLKEHTNYPLHVGVTEAGTEYNGIIKSAIGIGSLLLDGIGDTIRVSLTAPPEREVLAAKAILKSLGLRPGADVISCPTCGRCDIDIIGIANEVELRLAQKESAAASLSRKDSSSVVADDLVSKNQTIAVMGCAVNGPGEASHADYGIAGAGSEAIIFAKGKKIGQFPMQGIVDRLFDMM